MELIDRQAAIDAILNDKVEITQIIKAIGNEYGFEVHNATCDRHAKMLRELPPAQPELIEKVAYIRGFEQGRTQGMIDSQGEKK